MSPQTDIGRNGPRPSYVEYLLAEMLRTGLSRDEIQDRDRRDSLKSIANAREAAAELDAQRSGEAKQGRFKS